MFAAAFVWALRIQRYIQSHGGHSACSVFNGAIWRDYRTARQISKRVGRKPAFLIWFEALAIAALLFFILGGFALLIEGFK